MKKIIVSICTLALAAALLGTSTYAWFSMNKSVTATGMTVTAQSDSVWLVINTGDEFNKNGVATSVASANAEKKLYPVTPVTAFTTTNTPADIATPAKWHYTYSATNDKSEKDPNAEYTVCTNLDNYVGTEHFWVGLSDKSGKESASNLKIGTITLPENTGIKIIVTCGEKVGLATGDTLAETVTKDGVKVTIHYYIDGADANVFTNNLTALTGKVTISFNVD